MNFGHVIHDVDICFHEFNDKKKSKNFRKLERGRVKMHHCFANQAETDGLPSLFSTTKTLKSQLWPHASSNFRNPCCVAPCTIHISHQIPNQQTSCSQPVLLSLLTDHHHRIQFISSSVCKMNISTHKWRTII